MLSLVGFDFIVFIIIFLTHYVVLVNLLDKNYKRYSFPLPLCHFPCHLAMISNVPLYLYMISAQPHFV